MPLGDWSNLPKHISPVSKPPLPRMFVGCVVTGPPASAPAVPAPPPVPASEPARVATVPVDPPPTYADPNACTQSVCAAHDNARDCCAPFRALPHALDRALIAATVANVKPRAMTCGLSSAGTELVRVAVDVTPDGHVARADVVEAPGDDIGACVANVLRATTFPATATGGSFVARIDLSKG